MDHLIFQCEFKSDSNSEDGIITGYGSVFGNVDSSGDTVAPGAFTRSIADAKSGVGQWPAMLLEHGDNTARGKMPIGVWVDMSEDKRGLKLVGKLALKTKRGSDAYQLLRMQPRAAIDGLSIGYRAQDFELHRSGSGPNGAKRTLKAVDLVEVSLVTFPSNMRARVTSVKARLSSEEDWKKLASADFEMLRRLTNRRS
jgi:uncharacterized protein